MVPWVVYERFACKTSDNYKTRITCLIISSEGIGVWPLNAGNPNINGSVISWGCNKNWKEVSLDPPCSMSQPLSGPLLKPLWFPSILILVFTDLFLVLLLKVYTGLLLESLEVHHHLTILLAHQWSSVLCLWDFHAYFSSWQPVTLFPFSLPWFFCTCFVGKNCFLSPICLGHIKSKREVSLCLKESIKSNRCYYQCGVEKEKLLSNFIEPFYLLLFPNHGQFYHTTFS